jgi:hypothetical protein
MGKESVARAYNLLMEISVKGQDVERMCAARQLLLDELMAEKGDEPGGGEADPRSV